MWSISVYITTTLSLTVRYMATIPFVAVLRRPIAGTYCLSNRDGDFLVPVGGHDDVEEIPLSGPIALFRLLAQTEPSAEGIVRFADEYGWLGSERLPGGGFELVELVQEPKHSSQGERRQPSGDLEVGQSKHYMRRISRRQADPRIFASSERLDLWREEIARLNDLVSLWQLIKDEKNQKLKSRVKWDGRDSVFYSDRALITSRHDGPKIFEEVRKGRVTGAAFYHLVNEVNRSLAKINPILTLEKGSPRLKYVAHFVYATVWLEFAKAIEGNLEFKACSVCGTLFESNSVRSDRVYCSKKCNMTAYRRNKRKKEAKK